jgi:hypothetical protein
MPSSAYIRSDAGNTPFKRTEQPARDARLGAMNEDPLISELVACGASVSLATSCVQQGELAAAEQAALDACQRLERVVRELGLKLQSPDVPPPSVSTPRD